MISTRQLIFIISLVFFFVNRATSGSNASSSRQGEEDVEEVKKELEKLNINVGAVNSEHLRDCKLELTSAFRNSKPFDMFLHAFLYLNTADFLVLRTYSKAPYEYFIDLLSTAQDLNHPVLENPEQYCGRYQGQVGTCLRGIAEIGCQREDSGVKCFEKLYLDWKKDESIVYSRPIFGTEDLSDEDILTALNRGAEKYAGLPISIDDLARRLSDENLLREFCDQNENERRELNYLQSRHAETLGVLQETKAYQRRKPYFAHDWNLAIAEESYNRAHSQYIDLRLDYIGRARYNCYGIESSPYQTLLDEYYRRQNTYKQFGDLYATYLYDQITLFGRNMGLDSEERIIFNDPENFCVTFLLNNLDYYDWLHK